MAYIWRGLFTERNLRFRIDWASLIVGSKFTIFAFFYFVFESNFPSTSPRDDLTEGFLRYRFGGFIFGGAYAWRGLISEFYGSSFQQVKQFFTFPPPSPPYFYCFPSTTIDYEPSLFFLCPSSKMRETRKSHD